MSTLKYMLNYLKLWKKNENIKLCRAIYECMHYLDVSNGFH